MIVVVLPSNAANTQSVRNETSPEELAELEMPIIDSNKLLFESKAVNEVTLWHQNEEDYTPGEDDVPNIELKDRWIDFKKWSTVKAEYFCSEGAIAYFELVLERYSGCSAPQFGFCTSDFEKPKFGKFGTRLGVGDDAKSWGIDGERCMLWAGEKSEPYEKFPEWEEDDVLGFVCDMRSEDSRGNIATAGDLAKLHANIYVFVNGNAYTYTRNKPAGLAFKIPIPVPEGKTEGSKPKEEFRLWPAFTARGMRLGYKFVPPFRYLEQTNSRLSAAGIIRSPIGILYEGQQKSSLNTLQLPLIKLQLNQADGFSEDKLWRGVMGQVPPPTYKVQNELSNSQLSQAVNMLLIKSQLDVIQTATSMLVLRNRVHALKQKVESQEKELEEKKYLDLIDALTEIPIVGMLTISFVLPTKNKIQLIFKLFPFAIFAVQWILLITVGNFSLTKYTKAGGQWCLNNATSESRALMSAIAALILSKNVQRLVGLMESTRNDSFQADANSSSSQTTASDGKPEADGNAKTGKALKGFTQLNKLISNTDGVPRLMIFFILDTGMEICFASAVLLVNLFIVFVASEPLDMVLNCLALEFIAEIDNQMKDYLFRSWTEKDALLSSFESAISQSLDEKKSWWDAFTKRWVGEDDPKAWFFVISVFLVFFGFLFSFVFAPLATMAMIFFGPICKPGAF